MTAVPETARVEAIAAVLGEHVMTTPVQCTCGWRWTDAPKTEPTWPIHAAAALAALLDGERAAGWDEAHRLFCSDKACSPGIVTKRHSNPYRAGEVGGDE